MTKQEAIDVITAMAICNGELHKDGKEIGCIDCPYFEGYGKPTCNYRPIEKPMKALAYEAIEVLKEMIEC